jgi:hypothetical protein
MKTGTRRAVAVALLVVFGAACSGHSSKDGSGSSSKTGTVKVPPVHDNDLRPVLDTWLRRNHTPGVVVGVQVGTGPPVFVVSGLTETTAIPVGAVADAWVEATARKLSAQGDLPLDATIDKWLPRAANAHRITVRDLLTRRGGGVKLLGAVVAAVAKTDLATAVRAQVLDPFGMHDGSFAPTGTRASARDLLAFSAGYLRARVRGAHDLATSDFAVGRGGAGLGIDGVANDGICVTTKSGCAAGTAFFAVGASGSALGGSAVVVYDPVYDIGVAVVARSETVDVEDLALRSDLLAKVGKAVYDKTVGFTPRTTSTTAG